MNKIQISAYGRQILVDEDQVAYHIKKSELVNNSIIVQKDIEYLDHHSIQFMLNMEKLTSNNRKICNLNKKIRQNVQFV